MFLKVFPASANEVAQSLEYKASTSQSVEFRMFSTVIQVTVFQKVVEKSTQRVVVDQVDVRLLSHRLATVFLELLEKVIPPILVTPLLEIFETVTPLRVLHERYEK